MTVFGGNLAETDDHELELSDRDFKEVARQLRSWAGINLPDTKKTLVYSRLAKRVRALGLSGFSEYCSFVGGDAGLTERENMISALTTNVTSFFREDHHFDLMRTELLDTLIQEARKGGRVRIWSAGCSSGQEPYSIAFTILEKCPDAARLDIRILATDIDNGVLEAGRRGIYEKDLVEGVDPSKVKKFFEPDVSTPGNMRVVDEAQGLISFRQLNLMDDWPFKGPFDIIFCRNVAIYFDRETQQILWDRFLRVLGGQGYLFIGHSERVSGEAAASLKNVGVTTYAKIET